MKANVEKIILLLRRHSILLVVVPWLVYAVYLVLIASDEFESQSKLVVKSSESNSAFSASSALISSVTSSGVSDNTDIVEAYVLSTDLMLHLDETLGLKAHYSSSGADIFSRLSTSASRETLYQYFLDHVEASVDSTTSVITIKTKAYTADFAQKMNIEIVKHAERFINNIGNDLAKTKLGYAKEEHQIVESKLQQAKAELLKFQSQYDVLDPTAEGAAAQQIAFSLQATLAQKQAELNTMSTMMSDAAPEIQNIRRQIKALEEQVRKQKRQLSENENSESAPSVTELMAQYSNMQVQLQLAIQAFSSSLMSLENARVDAYQQLQHLVTIESPTLPEENQYPRITYSLGLFGVVLFMIFGILRIVIATIREL